MKTGILIIGGGVLQIAAIQCAQRMGLKVYLSDGNPQCAALDYADEFFHLSTKDIEGHMRLAQELKQAGKIAGVYTQGCDVEYTVAKAAEAAGLPGIPSEAALNCQDKCRTRALLNESGVDNIRFGSARTPREVMQAALAVGFPCVVKPLDNSASRGLTKVYGATDVDQAAHIALENCFLEKKVIVEELLEGEEYSVDTVFYEGKLYPAGISQRVFRESKQFAVQVGSMTPSLLSETMQSDMYRLMERAAAALGIHKGAFKGDLIVLQGKPRIIEVTARTSGGFDSQYRKPYSFGIDLMKCTIDLALNRPLDPRDLIPKWFKWSMTTSVFPEPGRVLKISGLEELKQLKFVRNVFMDLKVGDVVEPFVHCAKRVNHIIISADTYEKLMEAEATVQRTLRIETQANMVCDKS